MHPEVVSDEPGNCPKCGMKLLPSQFVAGERHAHSSACARARRRQTTAMSRRRGPCARSSGGIEWEDDMVEVNRMTTPANMRWKLVDRDTEGGAENHAIDWRFRSATR